MGVIRQNNEVKPIHISEITYADYLFDDDETENEVSESEEDSLRPSRNSHILSSRRRKQQKEGKTERKIRRFLEMDAQNGGMRVKRRMGARKTRRLENARMVYALADPDDICDDYSDILPSAVTAFAQLFIDHEKMRVWNEFIEKNEEEQRAILEGRENKKALGGEVGAGDGWHRVGGRRDLRWKPDRPSSARNLSDSSDDRAHHPAYSASSCFYRLDSRFKSLFLQKRLPWEFIVDREEELRTFFLETNARDAQWTSEDIPSSLHRLILHGISQYLALRSFGFEGGDGDKFVKVYNGRAFFIPPHKSLFTYVSDRLRARGGNHNWRPPSAAPSTV